MDAGLVLTTATAPAKRLLAAVPLYLALQRGLGADRLRYRSIEVLQPRAGERVLDVGCGPAYYLAALPAVDYVGYDTDRRYLDWARERWGERGRFVCAEFGPAEASALGQVDAVLLMGLLHHLDDDQCDALLHLLAGVLAPGGRVVAVDTAYVAGQRRFARWVADNDRGDHVRHPEEFAALARRHFAGVEVMTVSDALRVPGDFCLMRLSAPCV